MFAVWVALCLWSLAAGMVYDVIDGWASSHDPFIIVVEFIFISGCTLGGIFVPKLIIETEL